MTFPVTPLEAERRGKLVSRWALARQTGIYPQRLAAIERGHVEPKDQELKLISKALGLPEKRIAALIRDEAK